MRLLRLTAVFSIARGISAIKLTYSVRRACIRLASFILYALLIIAGCMVFSERNYWKDQLAVLLAGASFLLLMAVISRLLIALINLQEKMALEHEEADGGIPLMVSEPKPVEED